MECELGTGKGAAEAGEGIGILFGGTLSSFMHDIVKLCEGDALLYLPYTVAFTADAAAEAGVGCGTGSGMRASP
ncbi:MAG: hypothetical protein ABSF77_19700 [Spirochaetia bacterium]|jgi:hypothetical protein